MVLLASDGLEVLSEARISALTAQRGNDARGLARALLDAVGEASGQDNATVMVYRVGRKGRGLNATLAEMEAPTELAARQQQKNIYISRAAFEPETAPQSVLTRLKNYVFGNER